MQWTVSQYISIVPSIHTLFSILKTLVLFLHNYSTCMYMWGPRDIFESLFLRCYPSCLFWDRVSHCLVDGGLDEIGWPVPGSHLFLPPQHWDEKYTPPCPSFLTWILGVELRTSHLWEVNGDTFHFLLGFLFFVFGFFFLLDGDRESLCPSGCPCAHSCPDCWVLGCQVYATIVDFLTSVSFLSYSLIFLFPFKMF